MNYSPPIYVGIDPTAGSHPFTWAALDEDCRLMVLEGGELENVLSFMDEQKSAFAAVNAPPRPNKGLVREKLAAEKGTHNLRGADMRMVEYMLRERGISVSPTPSRPEISPAWIQMGYELHRQMEALGYQPFPAGDAPRQRMETNPHAIFCSLLGHIPLPKPTLEGRLQRQLALHGGGEEITDPMDFFEEITRHRILQGLLPMEFIYSMEQLDALAAAFAAWWVIHSPTETSFLGDQVEGQIFLPIKELKEKYS